MGTSVETTGLDALLDQLSQSLTPEMAKVVADFRANEATQARMELLAEKCNDGTLTAAEQEEYASAVRAGTLVSILQAKARKILQASNAGR
jgi:hypothetical protein